MLLPLLHLTLLRLVLIYLHLLLLWVCYCCGNLTVLGNVVLWKPASTAILSNYIFFKVLKESGLPDGVINWIPGSGNLIGEVLLNSPHFSGLHFTGSTDVFNGILFKTAVNTNKKLYRSYPRIGIYLILLLIIFSWRNWRKGFPYCPQDSRCRSLC